MPLVDPALSYFLAVYGTSSVNEAARRLFVAASAVSRQLARLEREVGAPLFERQATGVVPTAAGHAFAGYARRAVAEASAVVEEVQQRRSTGPVVRLAASDGPGHDLVPRVVAATRQRSPAVRFALTLTAPGAVTQRVRDGACDLGVTFTLAADPDVRVLHAQPAPLVAVVRADSPLAGRASVALTELAGHPLVLPPTSTTNRALVDLAGASAGCVLEPAFVCDTSTAALRFVRDAGGVAVLGRVSLSSAADGLVAVPLDGAELSRRSLQVQAQAGRQLPPVVQRFADDLAQALAATDC
ncbi:LysR family transcriptional regulator [Modestobacter sp. I12A-02628]|uniref:LysR family transcriptional regulator n=1 Tax=Goekera deserti TaxID=2497753 RepID=A0A7K3WG89_9ACTN|nr:LysR family transcriptional regulator [Goekera deserti]MPQ96462.1 LysR family transcriptional regulator [Goekera deserti]NDI47223.1 LysR family transcriptional regulator [Goekera deserti]NEL55376.1 LysR family transcriptional regulator [Goekera deserti]